MPWCWERVKRYSVRVTFVNDIAAVFETGEGIRDLGMGDWISAVVDEEILLRYVCDVGTLVVLRIKMIIRLVLVGPYLLGNRQPPVLGVRELGIYVEDDTAKRINPVSHYLTDVEFRAASHHHGRKFEISSRC